MWRQCGDDDVRGLVLNFGWVIDLVTEYSGDPSQRLPVRSRRFASWADLTYQDLADFVGALVEEAEMNGVPGLRVGPMFIGVGEFVNEIVRPPEPGVSEGSSSALYSEKSDWYDRHPEIYPIPVAINIHGPGLDPRVPLKADRHCYASRPEGIAAGESFAGFLGDQWRELTELVPFGLIHLRDEYSTFMHSGRVAMDGTSLPSPLADIESWTDGVATVCRGLKQGRPTALVMLYSSALGPTADLRVGQLDTQRLVADGYLDIWVDQTWGGAWQDWWDAGWKGWTFQFAYLLQRAALIAAANAQRETPCRHYKLIQALDGWEPYDTMHDYPGKLRWAMWAYSHVTTYTPEGLPKVPDGSYVAMMNDRLRGLVSKADVQWLSAELDAAEASAAELEEVFGPVLVHDREGLLSLVREHTRENASEWVEEYVGLLLKWGVPVLSAVSSEHLGEVKAERGLILQCSPTLSSPVESAVAGRRGPVLVTGRADVTSPEMLAEAGLAVSDEALIDAAYRRGYASSADLRPQGWVFLPPHAAVDPAPGVDVLYSTDTTPLLTATDDGIVYWQPPDWANPAERRLLHYQVGTVEPHIEAARALHRLSARAGEISIDQSAAHHTVSVHAWRSGGRVLVLLGNVESGWIGDSRYERTVRLRLPSDVTENLVRPALECLRTGRRFPSARSGEGWVFEVQVGAEAALIAQLTDS
jgi:hypothetical protein